MTKGLPPLEPGEALLFDHIPSLRSFKRTALMLIGLTLPAVIAMLEVFPDTFWPVVPLFVTCALLMQERVRLGRHRAWITNQRIILQGGQAIALADLTKIRPTRSAVRLAVQGDRRHSIALFFPEDGSALAHAIKTAKETA